MSARAEARYVRQSPRKVGRVLELIRGQGVELALNRLHFGKEKAAHAIEKVLRSAMANYLQSEEGKSKDPRSLYVQQAYANEGPRLKRARAASMGRGSSILRRTTHITIVVEPNQ